jgi:hypothetical protein
MTRFVPEAISAICPDGYVRTLASTPRDGVLLALARGRLRKEKSFRQVEISMEIGALTLDAPAHGIMFRGSLALVMCEC